jgi:hypothetical protein
MIKIKNIEVEDNYFLIVEFADGNVKRVSIEPYLNRGIFKQLKNTQYFKMVKNNGYFISWPNDQELSADTLYYS